MKTKEPKAKACKGCKVKFVPARPFQACCGVLCALEIARQVREKKARQEALAEKREDKAKREKQKTRGDWFAEAQTAFNAFIRERDFGKPCICCGKPMEPQRPGGSIDAGHYLSRGSSKHLALDERNCHAQRKSCNRPGGTTRDSFRRGMIERIGLEAVEALEADQEPRKYTIDDLKAIKTKYAALARQLRKERE
jgi:hypothetical protein